MLQLLKAPAMQDVASGLAARVLPGLASILAVPLLLMILGPQHYAAIGIFLTIQAMSGLLDIGQAAAVSRQAAWLSGTNAAPSEFAGLLRCFEIPYFSIAALFILVGTFGGYGILHVVFHLNLESIGLDNTAVIFLFASIGVRFPFALYSGYLSGRRYIQTANYIFLITECARILGGLALIALIRPDLSLFFAWQLLISVVATATVVIFSYKATGTAHAKPNWRNLVELRGVMLGAGQMLFLFVIGANLDKFLLPRFVSAAEYGIYIAVGQLAISNFLILQPIWAAFNPRLLGAMAASDEPAARQAMLSAAGVMTALCSAFMVGAMTATPAILHLWVGERGIGFDAVLILIAAGYGLLGLSQLALSIHQAAGRYFPTPLIFVSAIILIPVIGYVTLPRIDATSVAAMWALIYTFEFLAGAFAFRFYAPRLLLSWFTYVTLPFVVALVAGTLLSIWAHGFPITTQLALAVGCALVTALLVLTANPAIRYWVRYHLADEQIS